MSTSEVDGLSKSVRESMLKTLLEMDQDEKSSIDVSQARGASTAIEI